MSGQVLAGVVPPPALAWACAATGLLLGPVLLRAAPGAEVGAAATALNAAALGGVLLAASRTITGRAGGFALGTLNRYSLARVQVALWTVVVFAALLTAMEWNLLAAHAAAPLDIDIPSPVLAALGVSVGSAVAAPTILALRSGASAEASPPQLDAATNRARALAGGNAGVVARGQVGANSTDDDASWTDLFTGDDVAVTGRIDLSKVQQALLTVILVGAYFAMVLVSYAAGGPIDRLPGLGADAVRLLAVSHAGYLAFKAVPKPDPAA